MTFSERLKKLRKDLDLTQQEFADRIGSKRNTVATYEMGRTDPSTAVVSLICREFNVNEQWLRTGKGGMFAERTRDDELAAFMEELLVEESADFRRRLVIALSRLKTEQWDALEAVALSLMNDPGPAGEDAKRDPTKKLYVAARDGSRGEVEVGGDLVLPDESVNIPE